jgi:ABC-type glycerol-3-phosphate transport system substrate-binding protein
MTVVDCLNVAADDNNRQTWRAALASGAKADVCWTFDSARFKAMLKRALAS